MPDLKEQINQLKKEKNAVILAHYYTSKECQELADFVGDSFYLAKVAKQETADVIVFCGVSFMGESAKILNPEKTVLMPDMRADCAMAHMATRENIRALRDTYPDLAVVCYINSTAELKAESDVCVTSSNAVKIVRALPNEHIYLIPDRNLARFVAECVPEKQIIPGEGYCPIHAALRAEQLLAAKTAHPNAVVLVHPECEPEVRALADCIGSTAELIAAAKAGQAKEYLVCTEDGVRYQLECDNPDKRFYFPEPLPVCADMKLCTPERILHVLQTGENEVQMDEARRRAALAPLERMLELG